MSDTVKHISLGASACLLGEKVRYDGTDKLDTYLTKTLPPYVQWVSFCPEAEAGLGVPRPPMRLEYQKQKLRAVVIEDPSKDHTKALKNVLDRHFDRFEGLHGYVLKARSPSCGRGSTPVFKGSKEAGTASGIFTRRLVKQFPYLPVIESEKLADPARRENFFLRAYVLKRWQAVFSAGLDSKALLDFHEQHKWLINCHSRGAEKELARIAKKAQKKKLKSRASDYQALLMSTLRVLARHKDHVKNLESLAEVLAPDLSGKSVKHLRNTIGDFKAKKVSLDVPIQELRTLVHDHDQHARAMQTYLKPYPDELDLRVNLFDLTK